MWVDPLHYAWAALMVNHFEGRNLSVEGNIEARIRSPPDQYLFGVPDPLSSLPSNECRPAIIACLVFVLRSAAPLRHSMLSCPSKA